MHKEAYPLPCMDGTLNVLLGVQWFCTLNPKSGYWQVELDEEHRQKMRFVTHQGLY